MGFKKVLLIDDDADIREVAQLTLETMGGFVVLTACDGASGIATARREKPDLILLDVMMPVMDGVQTFRGLRAEESTRAIPVVFMTARIQISDRDRLSQLGARGIIAKPFDPMSLAEEVLAFMDA